jgi:hypothetical protein
MTFAPHAQTAVRQAGFHIEREEAIFSLFQKDLRASGIDMAFFLIAGEDNFKRPLPISNLIQSLDGI